jgi:hypothetical protein
MVVVHVARKEGMLVVKKIDSTWKVALLWIELPLPTPPMARIDFYEPSDMR